MSLTNFCCCCDLRRGCIVFSWIQMMFLTMTIATLIGYSDFFVTVSNYYTTKYSYGQVEASAAVALSMKIVNGILIIKIASCISLIWGIVKKCHLFYQPWLFISGIDASISSLCVFTFFILACVVSPFFFLAFFFYGGLTALHWYFWVCVFTVYKKDMKPSMISFDMEYENYTNSATISL